MIEAIAQGINNTEIATLSHQGGIARNDIERIMTQSLKGGIIKEPLSPVGRGWGEGSSGISYGARNDSIHS